MLLSWLEPFSGPANTPSGDLEGLCCALYSSKLRVTLVMDKTHRALGKADQSEEELFGKR